MLGAGNVSSFRIHLLVHAQFNFARKALVAAILLNRCTCTLRDDGGNVKLVNNQSHSFPFCIHILSLLIARASREIKKSSSYQKIGTNDRIRTGSDSYWLIAKKE